jgi:hypothetical protein
MLLVTRKDIKGVSLKLIKTELLSLKGTTIVLFNEKERKIAKEWYWARHCRVEDELISVNVKYAIKVFPPEINP